jgi:rubrerythrin
LIEREVSEDALLGALDDVVFRAAGDEVFGEYRCAECGYGVTVRAALPFCPMCGGGSWEASGRRELDRLS